MLIVELNIPCAAETNVVREDSGSIDIVIAVHSVGTINNWNFQSCLHGAPLKAVCHGHPLRRRRSVRRLTSPTAQNAPCTGNRIRLAPITLRLTRRHLDLGLV